MTFGTKFVNDAAAGQTDFYSVRNWSGSDGKFDSAGNLKWNAYTMNGQTTWKRKSVGGTYIAGTSEGAHLIGWVSNDGIAMYAKLMAKVRGHSFNLGIAAAESPQSLTLVANTITRIAKAFSAVRRGRIDLAVRVLGAAPRKSHLLFPPSVYSRRKLRQTDVSAMWLEIQYGWRPLIQDVYEGMSAYAAVMNPPRRSIVSASHGREAFNTRLTPGSLILQSSTTTISGKVWYEMIESLSVPRTLGLTNPAAVVWEKIPYSFVADWFIPIGTYLDVVSAIPNLTGRFMQTFTYKTETTGRGTTATYRGATISCRSINMWRQVPGSISVPFPQFVPLEKALSIGHLKNALALIHQAVFK